MRLGARVEVAQEPVAAPAGRTERTPRYGVDRLLALQRTTGNAAVGRLLRRPVAGAATASASATTPTAREWFEERVRERWGVGVVRAGTEADQVAEMRRTTGTADPSPTAISGWQAWDPAAASDLYADILAGFDAMGAVLGGVPEVAEIRFLAVDYDNDAGGAVSRPQHGASYSGGLLSVFRRIEGANWPLPEGRSTTVVNAPVTTG